MTFDIMDQLRSFSEARALPWLIGGLAVVALAACCLRTRRRVPALAARRPWRPTRFARRKPKTVISHRGPTVSVLISDADGTAPPWPGRVVDRSIEGLVMEIDQEAPVRKDATLRVRVAGASPLVASVQVLVRNCQPTPDGWVLDCPFVRTPCYSERMLFG